MNKRPFAAAILLLTASLAFGQFTPQTPNIHLYQPSTGQPNYGPLVNQNWSTLDTLLGCYGTVTVPGTIVYWNGSRWTCLAGNASGIRILQEDSSGAPSWVVGSGGGGGAPGGTNGQVQFNNAGAFGGLNSTGTGNVVRDTAAALTNPTMTGAVLTNSTISNPSNIVSPTVSNPAVTLGTFTNPSISALTLSDTTGLTQCLHVNASGVVSGTGSDCGSGGGGGTPGGSNGQIQYNNAGSFGGITPTGTGSVVLAVSPSVNGLTLGNLTGLTQCLHVDSSGLISGSGADCSTGGNGTPGIKSMSSYANAQTALNAVTAGQTLIVDGTFSLCSGTLPASNVTITSGHQGGTLQCGTANVPVLTISTNGIEVANLNIRHTVSPTTGGDGIVVNGGLTSTNIHHNKIQQNYNGANLGDTSNSRFDKNYIQLNNNDGVTFTANASRPVMQWYLDGDLSQKNLGWGYRFQLPSGFNGVHNTGPWFSGWTQTFGNSLGGFAFIGSLATSSGISDVWLGDVFSSQDNGTGFYFDNGSNGGRNIIIANVYAEQEGTYNGVAGFSSAVQTPTNAGYGIYFTSACDSTPGPVLTGAVLWENSDSGVRSDCVGTTMSNIQAFKNGMAGSPNSYQRAGVALRGSNSSINGGFFRDSGSLMINGVDISNNANNLTVNVNCSSTVATCVKQTTTPANISIILPGSITPGGGGGAVSSVFGQTGAVPNLSGDITTSGSSATTLPTVNSNVGSFTNANVTVNAKGQVTAAANGTGGSAVWGGITGTLSSQTDLQAALNLKANLASPTFTGTPAVPTAAPGTNTTQAASTAFVIANAASGVNLTGPITSVGAATTVAPAGVVAQKPDATMGVQYVAPTCAGGGACSDSNDGLSLGTAKLTLAAACQALPTGSASPSTCGRGTINMDQSAWPWADHTVGLWFMGPGDPNYASPPNGWLRLTHALQINCLSVSTALLAAAIHVPQCLIHAPTPGGAVDVSHPVLWWSSTNLPVQINGVQLEGDYREVNIGVCSDGTTVCNSSTFHFNGFATSTASGSASGGPGILVAGNSFGIYINDFVLAGNATATPNTDNAAAMLIQDQSGLVYLTNGVIIGGGGIIVKSTGGSLVATNVYTENDLYAEFWLKSTAGNGYMNIQNSFVSDCNSAVASCITVENDTSNPGAVMLTNTYNGAASTPTSQGPVTWIGGVYPKSVDGPNPLLQGSLGLFNERIFAQQDSARRQGGPVAAAAANLATLPTSGTGVTTGQPDPFGGTGAIAFAPASLQNVTLYTLFPFTGTVGDWLVGGVWVKANSSLGFKGAAPIDPVRINLVNNMTMVPGRGVTNGLSSSVNCSPQYFGGAQEWQWVWCAAKIATVSGTTTLNMTGASDATHPESFYGPVFYKVASGTLSDAEVLERASNLQSYGSNCTVGTLCTANGTMPYSQVFVKDGRPVVDVRAYGAKGDASTDDITAITAAVTAASNLGTLGSNAQSAKLFFPCGWYMISTPIILPRGTNTVSNGVVDVEGESKNCVTIQGTGAFSGSGMFQWAQGSSVRTLSQTITDLTLVEPAVDQTWGIYYKYTATNTPVTTANATNERMERLVLRNIEFRGNNQYQPYHIYLQGDCFNCTIENVYWDDVRASGGAFSGVNNVYDTVGINIDTCYTSSAPGNETCGFLDSSLVNIGHIGNRGGYTAGFQGRLNRANIESAFCNGVRGGFSNSNCFAITNSYQFVLTNVSTEGFGGAPEILCTNSVQGKWYNIGIGAPNNQGYGIGDGMDWNGCSQNQLWSTTANTSAQNAWFVQQSITSTSGITAGSGYSSAPTWTTTGGSCTQGGSGRTTLSGAGVATVIIDNGGNCQGTPTIVFAGGGGTGAAATAVMTGAGTLYQVKLDSNSKQNQFFDLHQDGTADLSFSDLTTNTVQWCDQTSSACATYQKLGGQTGTAGVICSGTVSLGTSAIASGAAATTVTLSCPGILTTDNIYLDFNASPLAVTGYAPSASGMLTIIKWPTANTINVSVVNNTGGSITPGAITLNARAVR